VHISFVHSTEEFQNLEEEWNELLDRSATKVPFLRHEYLLAWWTTLGGGEWSQGELWIGVGREDNGELIGLAPLFRSQSLDGRPRLMLIGTLEISDYLDLIVPKEKVDRFTQSLLTALDEQLSSTWQVLDLYNIPETSSNIDALEEAAKQRGWDVLKERLQPCPVIALAGTWEEYLASLSKKQRHELRRKMRRASQHSSEVVWRIVQPEDDIDTEVDILFKLMAYDAKKEKFLTSAMRSQFIQSLKSAHANEWLHLSFLEVGGEPAAGALNFDYEGRLWIYNSGINPTYLSLSPGWVLLGNLIQWAIENNRRAIDFMRGDETYKYRLGGVDTFIKRLTISR
jgi:CelD/BcsL family acetyltransferase involved in cellulose biosynthesis